MRDLALSLVIWTPAWLFAFWSRPRLVRWWSRRPGAKP